MKPFIKPYKKRGALFPSGIWIILGFALLLMIWAESSFAVVGNPMVVYSEEGQTAIKYSTYSSGSWATGATAADGPSNVKYWKVSKTHPAGRKRATVFLQENTPQPRLYASLWDESEWDDGTGSPYGDTKDLGEISAYYRCFDAAYEQLSGKLMVVAGTAENTISYWTWDAGTWSGPSTYQFTNYMGSMGIFWIRLAAKPASNEITLIAAGSNFTANALVWSGSAWGNESNLTSSLTTNAQEAIGVEYIRAWGDIGKATVFWATANTMNAKVWSGSSWGSTVSKGSLSASIRWLRVKADPNSNKIAVAYEDSSDDIYALIWNAGSWFTNTNSIDTAGYGSYANHRPFDVIYETGAYGGENSWKMGHLLVVYADTTELRYRHCTTTSSSAMTCAAESNVRNGATTYQAYWVQLERAPDNTIHLAIHDTNEDLVTWTWNNTSWTYENTISSDLERDANHNDEVFALFPMPEARAIIVSSTDGEYTIDYSRYHDGAAPPAMGAVSTGYENYWKVVKSSADGSKQIAVSVDFEGTWQPHLWGTIYNGSSWSTIKDFGQIWSYQDWGGNYVSRHRSFDVAFETSSGHILVVATKSSTPYECWYWTYNGTIWSSATSLTFSGIWNGQIKWVKLASNPNASSDEIALVVGGFDGSSNRAIGRIWNASSWGTDQVLTTALSVSDQEAVAVEYMQTGSNGGKALFVWMESYYIYGRVWNGSSWDTAQSKAVPGQYPQWLRLAADPSSDDLIAAYETDTAYLYALKWTGAAWETSAATTISSNALYGDDEYNRAFDVIWESGYGHAGHALIAYSLSGGGGNTYYKHYDGSSWGSTDTLISIGGVYWIELARTIDNTIHLTGHEASGNHLTTATWNNASWSYKSVSTGIFIEYNANYGLARGTIQYESSSYDYTYNQVFSIAPVATTAPQIHVIDYNFGTIGASITLYGVGFGNAQGSSTVKFYNNQTATVTSWSDVKIVVAVPSSTASGYITVTRGSNTDTICFNAITGAPTVTAILPDKGSNFSDIDIAYITGTNFSPGLTLKVKKSGQSDITATNVTVASSNRIEVATFNITSAATGLWNVEVTNPDTNIGTGNNLFAIHSPYQVTTGTQANYADLAYPNERHLVRDSSGNWYAVFYSNDSGKIYITRSADGGLTWDSPTTLVGTGGIIDTNAPFRFVSVDVYRTGNVNNDRIHIVWRRGINSDSSKYLWYSRCINLASYTSGTFWKKADEVTTGFEQLDNTSIASEYLTYPDIAVDSGGYPHVAWNYNYGVGTSESIRYRTTRPSGSWATTVIVAVKNETGCGDIPLGYPSIDTDSSNSVHISYSQYYNTAAKYVIRYAKSTNYTSFSKSNLVENTSRNFYQSSLIVDSADKIYVAALDDTNRDLFWGHYNGSTWSTSNNLTNGSFDIESAVVGAKMGSGMYDHILLAKVYDASSNKKIIYWRWDSTNNNWNKYSEELDTGNDSRSYVTIEKHAPASFEGMGYLFYDTSGDRLYFDGCPDIGKFEYKKKITLNCSGRGTSCSGGLSNFPVLIDTTNWLQADKDKLKTVANNGHVYRSEGYDIIFRASDEVTQLPHEIEKYDGSTGTLIAWVKVDPLFNNCPTTGTDIYMFYGNAAITSSTELPTSVWNNNYKGVWHLKEDPSGTPPQMKNSVADANHGSSNGGMLSGAQVMGKIDGSLNFDGSNDYISAANDGSNLNVGQVFTVEAWIKRTATGVDGLLTKAYDTSYSFKLAIDGSNRLELWTYDNGSQWGSVADGDLNDTTNYHYVGGYSNGTNLKVFIDGSVLSATGSTPASIPYDSNSMFMGAGRWSSSPNDFFNGILDEVRISNVARDACWIETTFNTVNSPSYTLDSEAAAGPTVIELNSFAAKGEGSSVNVQWETKTEIHNLGFNLYRSTERNGTYTKLNNSLIPGLLSSVRGKKYSFTDGNVTKGKLYYYKLEDIDLKGERTLHGPVCVDWDGDGIPDDQDSDIGDSDPGPGGYPGDYAGHMVTHVELRSLEAHQTKDGVLLRWKTGYEVNNLGFHIYREENGQMIRLTPEPVAGSALLAGSRLTLRAGHHYHWWDISAEADAQGPLTLKDRPFGPRGQSAENSVASSKALLERSAPQAERSVVYWLEDIDLNGKRTMHGPVTPTISRDPIPEKFRPELLSEVGWKLQEKYHHYWKARDLRERLKATNVNRYTLLGKKNNLKTNNHFRITNNRKAPPTTRPEADLLVQQYLASRPAVKLLVKEEGWYRVSQSELVAAGLSPRANPRYLQLFVEGREVPMGVIGGKDGRFGPRDAIEFYGVGLDTPSTDTRVYWLVEGHKPGKRVYAVKGYSGSLGSLSSSSFPYTVQKRDRWIYLPAIKNGEEENFFGAVVYGAGVDQVLEVKHLDLASSGDAWLEVVLQGATTGPHRVKVYLNDEEVGEVVFEGQTKRLFQVEVAQALLLEGDNLVTLIPQGGDMDVSLVDSIRLTYWHSWMAEDNGLRFRAKGGSWVSIGGFSDSGIRVFDITDSNEVMEVIGRVELQQGAYGVGFNVPGSGERVLLALSEGGMKNPVEIASNQPSSWHQEKGGYGLIMISHREFFGSLKPLIKLRQSQGYRVALIDVEDLYDEFSFGHRSPKAIKDFLASAKGKWRRAPRYVLLVGDASFDPRNYLGMGELDIVPTKLIDTVYLETASDDWFVDFNNDGLPEVAVGRLPVQTKEEAAVVVSKIVGYERSGKKREALLVADRVDKQDEFSFEGASEEIGALLPSSLMVRKIYRGKFSSDEQTRGVLLSAINQGPLLVNFIGHGSIEIWRGIFTSEDAEALTNGYKLPFFVNMTCLNGYFQDPYSETMAEALLKAQGGGAVAIWTSSGLTEPDQQAVMNKELIKLLFGRESLTLGEATVRAKAATSDQDIRKTWILFGDPTTRLRP